VVIYDRIRATIPVNSKRSLNYLELKPYINKAINDTMSRTINSTLTTLFAAISIWIFATGVISSFAKVLTVGISFGVFTSVFISPALYLLAKKYFHKESGDELSHSGPSREQKEKGVV
jgi:preprotein translocase subunit SecF